jgi:hypothetical protein
MIRGAVFTVLVATFIATARAQIISVTGQNCVSTSLDVPLGGYYGGLAECSVTATCEATVILSSLLAVTAYSGLACPAHTVENNAYGGWNQTNSINAHAIAIDIVSFGIRGSSFVQETCGFTFPVTFTKEDRSVCDAVLMDPPLPGGGGGDGGGPDNTRDPPITCYYGYGYDYSTSSCADDPDAN